MAESMAGLKRSCRCAEVTEANVGQEMTLMGWVQKSRNKGGIIFTDLRDRSGIIQIIFEESDCGAESFAKAEKLRSEFVIAVEGRVEARSGAVNENLATGAIEVRAESLRILAESETPPFPIEEKSKTKEDLRLEYRFLDLRRPDIQRNLMLRSNVLRVMRDFMANEGFLEIETPILQKSTPEGARDYLVPSRVHPGAFYALPQSPQLYKQILMISGMDRYYQVAKCFRDEDLRADRQPEFTQIDMEMSFVSDQEDVMGIAEGMMRRVFKETKGIELPAKIRRMTYKEAMERFGSDKPDTRFGLELVDISDLVKGCGFQVFSGAIERGGSVRMINAKGFYKGGDQAILSRKDVDALLPFVKAYKAKGLAWIAVKEDGLQSPIIKFLGDELTHKIIERANAEVGDIIFFGADTDEIVFASLGALRLKLARIGKLIPENTYDFLWVTEFPMFHYDEEEKRFVAEHHPFTMPMEEDLPLLDTDPTKVRSQAYDFVINGYEAGGGSVRIHSQEIQNKIFGLLGFSDEQIKEKFGFFVTALKYGTPPHGGLAFGLDRLVMLLSGTEDIKDVIAFPKVQNASDLMSESPSPVEDKQLKELALKIDVMPEKK